MGVGDWANGSAFYYFVRDKMFGSAGFGKSFWYFISDNTFGVLAVTWGSIILELAIALLTVLSARYRIAALTLAVFLHAAIWLAMGLFSFSLVMIGVSVIVANPDRVSLRKGPVGNRARKKGVIRAEELEMVGEA
ncbi:beta-carotene 15,15'-monooxygenase [Mycobacteroides abscessus]|nr:beta-carotene 15,15'-monooxygenase [Mycobacteroides abscessus]